MQLREVGCVARVRQRLGVLHGRADGLHMNKSMGPDIITNTGGRTHTHSFSLEQETMELLSGFHLWLNGKAANTMRS